MATILSCLKSINAYPVPEEIFKAIAIQHGFDLAEEASQSILLGKAYNLAKADMFRWLSYAPNITQGGISFTFDSEQRKEFRAQAEAIEAEYADDGLKTRFGYKGSRL